MRERESFFRQLIRRRVPQILGAYVAGLWLAVEIGGWMTEQLALPQAYSLYLFVLLVAFLPSVVVLAWRHGQPGPDAWGRLENVVLPANVMIAIGLLVLVAQIRPPVYESEVPQPEAALIERTVVDEDGQEQVFQVVREGYGVTVLSLFWPQAGQETGEPSWESYAAPLLLGLDLDQDPLISGGVALDRTVIEQLASAGFDKGLGEPLSLGLRIASDRGADFLIRGDYKRTAEGYVLQSDLYSVEDGALVESFQAEGPTLIDTVDLLGDRLGERLVRNLDRGEVSFRPISLKERTTSNPLAIEPFILGINALLFDSDFDKSVALLQEAVDLDPSFAHAWFWMHQVLRSKGDLVAANAAIEQALAHDYKLDTEVRLALRANQYAIAGDIERAVRVLRMWTEVEPFSLRAWTTLTRNLLLIGEIDEARSANEKAQEIDPDLAALDRTQAQIEELAGNLDLASEILDDYLKAEPQDDAAWISLGDIRERAGDVNGARTAYERASFVASNDFRARERLLRLEARAGDPARAVRDYRQAMSESLQPTEKANLVQQFAGVLSNLGRMQEVLDLIEAHEVTLEQSLPPSIRTLTIEGLRAGVLTSLGRYDEALALLERAEQEVSGPFGPLFGQARIPIYEKTGDLASAQGELEKLRTLIEAFDMPGQEAQFHAFAARLLAMQEDYAGALTRLDEAQRALRGTSLSLISEISDPLTLQSAEYRITDGQASQALSLLDSFLLTHPNSSQARLLKARALHALGRIEEANAQLAAILSLLDSADPDYQLLIESRELAQQWGA